MEEVPPSVALVSLVVAAVGGWAVWCLLSPNRGDLDKLPGPPRKFFFGNVADLLKPDMHAVLVAWANKYGPVYRFDVPGNKNVLVCDPTLIPTITSRSGLMKKSRPLYKSLDELCSPTFHTSLITTPDIEKWQTIRRTMAAAFSPAALKAYFPTVKTITQRVVDQLKQRAHKSGGGAVLEVDNAMERLTMDTIGLVAYGMDLGASQLDQKCELLEALKRAAVVGMARAKSPLLDAMHAWLPFLPACRANARDREMTYRLSRQVMERVKAGAPYAADDRSVAACFATLSASGVLSEAEMFSNVAIFLLAGMDTTGHSMAYTLYEIAANPAVQSKLVSELQSVGLLDGSGRLGRELRYDDLSELRYLDMVYRESLRLHTITPGGTIRWADRDIVIGPYTIPKGTSVWAAPGALHNSVHNFTQPDRFWPERWEWQPPASGTPSLSANGEAPMNGTAGNASCAGPHASPIGHLHNPKGSWSPFSSGPRDCIGQHLAMMEGRTVLACLVQQFSLEVDAATGSPEDVRRDEVYSVTLHPAHGLHLNFMPR